MQTVKEKKKKQAQAGQLRLQEGLWGELQADGCVESQTRFRWVKAFQEVRINQGG
jgi:hypothetical protein